MKLLHLVPTARGEMTTAAAESLAHVVAFCARNGISWTMARPESCFVEDSRNQAVMSALVDDYDLLLMQDPDVAFDAVAFPLMLKRLQDEQAAAVAGVVRRRGRTIRINSASAQPGCVHEHAEIGTALMLLDVAQLDDIEAPWFQRVTNESGTRTIIGEDIAFCRKLKDAGKRIIADFTFYTEHRDEQWLSTAPLIKAPATKRDYELTKTPTGSGDARHVATSA